MRSRSSRLSRAEEPFYRALGHFLRLVRLRAGLTLDELAARVDQNRVSIWFSEQGLRSGSALQYYELATALELGPGHALRMAAVIAGEVDELKS